MIGLGCLRFAIPGCVSRKSSVECNGYLVTASRELIAALSGEASGRDGNALRVAERLAGEIEGFDRNLLRHLENEEALIIPLILERIRDDPNFR